MLNRITVTLLLAMLFSTTNLIAQNQVIKLTLDDAMQSMYSNNKSIKIADQEVEWSKSERQRLNSFWYPKVTTTGAYVHMSNEIKVKESLSQFTDPAIDYIHSIDPSEKILSEILSNVGKGSFSVPLMPQNTTTIDAIVTLPIFTGGKRIFATQIGRLMVDVANTNRSRIDADQRVLLTNTYYTLLLGQKIVEINRQTYAALETHFQNALKLETNGIITKADRLFFQVNRDEAKRELETSIKNLDLIVNTFKIIANIETDDEILPTSPLFIINDLPSKLYFKQLAKENNYLITGLNIQENIQMKQLNIAKSDYLPNIEIFGKQTVYSHGIPKNLVPRSMIGVGFSWNIFDGLDREKKIKQAKIKNYTIGTEKEKVVDDLTVAIDKFYNQTQDAIDNLTALKTTNEMTLELVRSRKKALVEGMATSSEVVDAELMLSKIQTAMLLAYFQFDSALINLLAICGTPESFNDYKASANQEYN